MRSERKDGFGRLVQHHLLKLTSIAKNNSKSLIISYSNKEDLLNIRTNKTYGMWWCQDHNIQNATLSRAPTVDCVCDCREGNT